MGGFGVTAEREDGILSWIEVTAEKGGVLRLANTFGADYGLICSEGTLSDKNGVWEVSLKEGECQGCEDKIEMS